MKHFSYVLYVGFHAQRNLCDKQNVLFYGHSRTNQYITVNGLGEFNLKHFPYVLYVGFHAQRNFCDKQNVLFYHTPRMSKKSRDDFHDIEGHEYRGSPFYKPHFLRERFLCASESSNLFENFRNHDDKTLFEPPNFSESY